jgi:hypothetical protein
MLFAHSHGAPEVGQMITRPKKLEALCARLPENKRAAIEQRDAAPTGRLSAKKREHRESRNRSRVRGNAVKGGLWERTGVASLTGSRRAIGCALPTLATRGGAMSSSTDSAVSNGRHEETRSLVSKMK